MKKQYGKTDLSLVSGAVSPDMDTLFSKEQCRQILSIRSKSEVIRNPDSMSKLIEDLMRKTDNAKES